MLSVWALAAGVVLCYTLARVVYNVFFHPIANIPGPWLAAATSWYETYFDLLKAPGDGGRFHHELARMHDVYGPIVRIGPNEVHVNDPAWFDTFKPPANSGAKRSRFPPRARATNTPLGTFGTVDHDVHKPRKAVLAPFYSKRNVTQHEAILQAKTRDFCDLMRKDLEKGVPTRLDTAFLAFTLDVVCELVMGFAENILWDRNMAIDWRITISTIFEMWPLTITFPELINSMQKLPMSWMERMNSPFVLILKFYERIRQHAESVMCEFRAREAEAGAKKEPAKRSGYPTIFHAILDSDLPPSEKSLERLEQEGREQITAGSETSIRMLTSSTYFTLTTPDALERLRAELRPLFAADAEPEVSKFENLPWLTATLKETLRLCPIISSRMPMVTDVDISYGKYRIPPGVGFSMDFHDVMLDPNVYAQPLEFHPERWLADDTRAIEKAFCAFSKGGRVCSGMNLAWAEMYILVANMFGRFDFELYDMDYDRDLKHTRDCFIGVPSKASRGLRVKVLREF